MFIQISHFLCLNHIQSSMFNYSGNLFGFKAFILYTHINVNISDISFIFVIVQHHIS